MTFPSLTFLVSLLAVIVPLGTSVSFVITVTAYIMTNRLKVQQLEKERVVDETRRKEERELEERHWQAREAIKDKELENIRSENARRDEILMEKIQKIAVTVAELKTDVKNHIDKN